MSLRINDVAPNFTAETTQGPIDFHEWIGDGWAVLFSHPKDFTPVCTTELGYMARIKPEFDKRNCKILGISVDGVSNHQKWSKDIESSQGHAVNYPLIGDPELIFLDEPTTGFDPAARRNAWETMRSLRDLGKTILLTTHYLDEAQELADRVAIVKDGRVLAIGPPRELGVGGSHYRVAYRDRHGELVEQQTDDPTRLLHELTTEALARGERVEELSVGRPTLEDVYLELTADG